MNTRHHSRSVCRPLYSSLTSWHAGTFLLKVLHLALTCRLVLLLRRCRCCCSRLLLNLEVPQVLHPVMCLLEHLSIYYMLSKVAPTVWAGVILAVTVMNSVRSCRTDINCHISVYWLSGSWWLQIMRGLDLRARRRWLALLHRLPVVKVRDASHALVDGWEVQLQCWVTPLF